MKNKCLTVSDFNNLHLHIYTLGYPNEGEAEITILLDEKKPLITIVTDCYFDKANGCHAIDKVLNLYGISTIDAFVWSHPHKDHSLGIEELLDKFDPLAKAVVVVPDGVMGVKNNDLAVKTIKYLNSKYLKEGNLYVMGVTSQERRTVMKWTLNQMSCPSDMSCRLEVVSPMSAKEVERCFSLRNVNCNYANIVYTLNLNSQNYLFTGDLCQDMVEYLDEECLVNVPYLKIPHHGSNEPINFYNKLRRIKLTNKNANFVFAVTTVKKSSELPNDDVMERINSLASGVYSTHFGKKKVGVVKCSYGILNLNSSNVSLLGNAIRFVPKRKN